ncbi:MAG: c-type cytochrome [Myxococcales bacterium]|nr:c-type cytochrome [Myxococcales bacterium]
MKSQLRVALFLSVTVAAAGCGKKSSEGDPAAKAPPPTAQPTAPAAPTAPAPTPPPAPAAPTTPDKAQVAALFKPLPANFDDAAAPASDAVVALGQQLYFDTRLSKNQDVSCNTCHALDKFGVDGLATSKGHKGQLGTRNSPTVLNAAGHFAQFWDGRAATVEEQAKGPMMNPVEMAMADDAHVVAVLQSIPGYADAFAKAFPGQPDAITLDNAAKAIGAFERKLATPAPFDKYLAGDEAAMSDDAKHGLAVFMASGCTGCHSGPLLGGTMYMKTGLTAPYADTTDTGRFAVTKVETDKFMFKVPSLRNVAKTAPYFHDGKIADLPAAIREMGRLQLGKAFTDDEVKLIGAFLDSLTGEVPAALAAQPKLPKSGPKTPKPDPS